MLRSYRRWDGDPLDGFRVRCASPLPADVRADAERRLAEARVGARPRGESTLLLQPRIQLPIELSV